MPGLRLRGGTIISSTAVRNDADIGTITIPDGCECRLESRRNVVYEELATRRSCRDCLLRIDCADS